MSSEFELEEVVVDGGDDAPLLPRTGKIKEQALWSGIMDSSRWWSGLDFIPPNDLLPGDVLITKNYKMSPQATGTVYGQAFFSYMVQSTCYSTHAMLCTGRLPVPSDLDGGDGGGSMIAHSSSGNQWQTFSGAATYTKKPNLVFRPDDDDLGLRAARDGIMLCGYDPDTGVSRKTVLEPAQEEVTDYQERTMAALLVGETLDEPAPRPVTTGFIPGGYSADARWKSVFKMKYRGSGAEDWIKAVRANDLGGKAPANTAVVGTEMFCSSFVAVCYELQGNILNVDPRAMSVKALESMLNRSGSFKLIGRTWNKPPDADPLH